MTFEELKERVAKDHAKDPDLGCVAYLNCVFKYLDPVEHKNGAMTPQGWDDLEDQIKERFPEELDISLHEYGRVYEEGEFELGVARY